MLVLPSHRRRIRHAGARGDDGRACRSLSAKRGALPEVVGDAGTLVEPDDTRRWRRRCGVTWPIRRRRPRRRARAVERAPRIRGTRAPRRCSMPIARVDVDAASTPADAADDRHRRARAARRTDRRRTLSRRAAPPLGCRREAAARVRPVRAGGAALSATRPADATIRAVVVGSGRGTWWEQTHLRRAVRADPPDVFFAPAYTAPLGLRLPLAVTIHDVSFVAHPEWFRAARGRRRRLLTRQAARAADGDPHRLGVLAARDRRAALGRPATDPGHSARRHAARAGPAPAPARAARPVRRLHVQSPAPAGDSSPPSRARRAVAPTRGSSSSATTAR